MSMFAWFRRKSKGSQWVSSGAPQPMHFIGRMLRIREMQTHRCIRNTGLSSSMRRHQLRTASGLHQQQSHRQMSMSAWSICRRSNRHENGLQECALRIQYRLPTNTTLQSAHAYMLQRLRRAVMRRKRHLHRGESNASVSVPARVSRRSHSRRRMQIGRRLFTLCRIGSVRTQSKWQLAHLQMSTRLHWLPRINRMPSDRPMRQRQRMSDQCTMHWRPLR